MGLPRLELKYAFVECPSMIMDPRALLEVHTILSRNSNRVVFQAYHPESPSIREENFLKAQELAQTWGLPQLEEESQLQRREESEFRRYDAGLGLSEYAALS